jgi:lactate dehydrogenase-like 2-hydroxyacid dehydrogenase
VTTAKLADAGVRVSIDRTPDKVGAKIRLARLDRVPYMIVLGQKEVDEGTVSIRRRDTEELTMMSLEDLLKQSDFVSLHSPATLMTKHMINDKSLALMKPSAVIVNTSRGEVIDENALTRMLRAGEIAGAGLDVFERGHDINPRLRELSNVVLLPHMGSATVEGRIEMGEKVIINIKTFADGHRPPDQVVPAML